MKYIATITGVQEIGIQGAADPDPWEGIFAKLGLEPAITDGKVGVLLNTLSAKWMGIRFREAIIAIDVLATRDGKKTKAVFLDLAFQSLRLFALAERGRFRTPFLYASIKTSPTEHAGFEVRVGDSSIYSASLAADDRPREQDDSAWDQPIYLPSLKSIEAGQRDVFYAKISGCADVFPFNKATDQFSIGQGEAHDALNRLRASGFQPSRWRLCVTSEHSRSGTEREMT